VRLRLRTRRLEGLCSSGLNGPFGSLRPTSNVNALSPLLAQPAIPPHLCFYVISRFQAILSNIAITDVQCEDGEKKHAGVRSALNRHYWNVASDTANSLLIGSWGKDTRVSSPVLVRVTPGSRARWSACVPPSRNPSKFKPQLNP